jgi:inner membrane transporter RhtA
MDDQGGPSLLSAPDPVGPPERAGGVLARSPAWVLVLVAVCSVQFGGALAATLFGRVGPTGAVTLRLVLATLILLAVVRPRVRGIGRRTWLTVAGYGASLGLMNLSIYAAFSRMELGAAVTVEFCGPLVLAAVLSKRVADGVAVGLAAVGVVLVSGHQWADIFRPAVLFALMAGAMWASYILLAARVSTLMPRLDGLAVGMTIATVLIAPAGLVLHGRALVHGPVLAIGLAVAVMSSVLPYSLELVALRRMPARVFGVLQSTEPALAALAGWAVLSQSLTPEQILGVAAVIGASVLVTLGSRASTVQPDPD